MSQTEASDGSPLGRHVATDRADHRGERYGGDDHSRRVEEVADSIYHHLRKDSPFTNTLMIAMANDRIGYIIDGAAYDTPRFEAMGTPLERGHAETAVVHGLVDMMCQYWGNPRRGKESTYA